MGFIRVAHSRLRCRRITRRLASWSAESASMYMENLYFHPLAGIAPALFTGGRLGVRPGASPRLSPTIHFCYPRHRNFKEAPRRLGLRSRPPDESPACSPPSLCSYPLWVGTAPGFERDYDILAGDAHPQATALSARAEVLRMKAVGFVMLLAGWFLVLAAVVLFPSASIRAAFVLVGIAVEGLGLFLAFRSHLIPKKDKE